MAKILVFNWKMNPKKIGEALELARASDCAGVVVAPPFLFIEEVGKALKRAKLGAQDLFWENPPEDKGAATGEVSGVELKSIGVDFVIVGHSERRQRLGETDAIVAKKFAAARDAGLMPILCVGETAEEKKAGQKEEVIKRQIDVGLSIAFQSGKLDAEKFLVAYEPVWAIGTGRPETPESAAKTITYIGKFILKHYKIKPRILYGGSVDSQNLDNYLEYKEVDGALIGGASLKKEEIKKLVALINN